MLRDDLAAVVIDDDIVVYDPAATTSHVLSGGAVAVWIALENGGVEGVAERVAELTGSSANEIDAEVLGVVDELRRLGLIVDLQGPVT